MEKIGPQTFISLSKTLASQSFRTKIKMIKELRKIQLLWETHISRYIDSLVVCLQMGVSTQSRYLPSKCLLERREENDNNSELRTFRDTQ